MWRAGILQPEYGANLQYMWEEEKADVCDPLEKEFTTEQWVSHFSSTKKAGGLLNGLLKLKTFSLREDGVKRRNERQQITEYSYLIFKTVIRYY